MAIQGVLESLNLKVAAIYTVFSHVRCLVGCEPGTLWSVLQLCS